jgi:hypothetical protein
VLTGGGLQLADRYVSRVLEGNFDNPYTTLAFWFATLRQQPVLRPMAQAA